MKSGLVEIIRVIFYLSIIFFKMLPSAVNLEEEKSHPALPFTKAFINRSNKKLKGIHDNRSSEESNELTLIFSQMSLLITCGYIRKNLNVKHCPAEIQRECNKFYDDALIIFNEGIQMQCINVYINQCFMSFNPCTVFAYVYKLRRILSIEENMEEIIEIITKTNIIQRFINYLKLHHMLDFHHAIVDKLLLQIFWVLSNITASERNIQLFADHGVIEILATFLNDTSHSLRVHDQIVWVIANLAGDGLDLHNQILKSDIISILLGKTYDQYLRSEKKDEELLETFQETVGWLLTNLVRRAYDLPPWPQVLNIIKIFEYTCTSRNELKQNNENTIHHLCWSLKNISKCKSIGKSNAFARILDRNGLLSVILNGLEDSSAARIHVTSHILKNLIVDTDDDWLITKKEIFSAVGEITASSRRNIEIIIGVGIFPLLFDILRKSDNFSDVKVEILSAISNAIKNGSIIHLKYFVDNGLIESLCEIFPEYFDGGSFFTKKKRFQLLKIVVGMFEKLLRISDKRNGVNVNASKIKKYGGLECLQRLCSEKKFHRRFILFVSKIINKYF